MKGKHKQFLNWFLGILFFLISPWLLQLLFMGFEPWWQQKITLKPNEILDNLINNSSTDYLFFQGDKRIKYGTQETGLLYIFQLPLIVVGFYTLFTKYTLYFKKIFLWLIAGFLLSGLFTNSPNFSVSLLYILPIQTIAFMGLIKILHNWPKRNLWFKYLTILFFIFSLYEIIIFFHILIVHYPKRLLLQ